MARPRDSQRQKVYRAEDSAFDTFGGAFPQKTWTTVPEMQAYVDKLTDSAWFKRNWPGAASTMSLGSDGFHHHRAITVFPGKGARRAFARGRSIYMPRWSRKEAVVLHEIAHVVTRGSAAAHGWEFCANYLLLVQHQLGKKAAETLRTQFKVQRVKYTKPRAKRPMTEEQKAVLRERLVLARAAAAARRADAD